LHVYNVLRQDFFLGLKVRNLQCVGGGRLIAADHRFLQLCFPVLLRNYIFQSIVAIELYHTVSCANRLIVFISFLLIIFYSDAEDIAEGGHVWPEPARVGRLRETLNIIIFDLFHFFLWLLDGDSDGPVQNRFLVHYNRNIIGLFFAVKFDPSISNELLLFLKFYQHNLPEIFEFLPKLLFCDVFVQTDYTNNIFTCEFRLTGILAGFRLRKSVHHKIESIIIINLYYFNNFVN